MENSKENSPYPSYRQLSLGHTEFSPTERQPRVLLKLFWKARTVQIAIAFPIPVLKKQASWVQHTHTSFGRKHTEEQGLILGALELVEHTPLSSKRTNHNPASKLNAPVYQTMHWKADVMMLF